MGLYLYRLMGAAMLDAGMYEGIEADRRTNLQAAVTVLLASVAAGVGATGWYGVHPALLVAVGAIACATWVAWAVMVYHIGTRMLREPQTSVTLGELLRTTGFAAAPGLLLVFAMLPAMSVPVFAGTGLWMLAAMVVAVQHALDFGSTWRAVAVCVIGVSLSLALAFVLGIVWGPTLS
jgi:hypothetical protein